MIGRHRARGLRSVAVAVLASVILGAPREHAGGPEGMSRAEQGPDVHRLADAFDADAEITFHGSVFCSMNQAHMTVPSPLDNVRAQYEALPYPSREPRDEAIRLITGTPSHILEINHYLFSRRLNFNRPFRALVAGGGTGDACIMLAQQLADRRCPAEVVYLDLSSASRHVCEGRAKARGLRNVQFLTGSLLDLPSRPTGQLDY